MVCRGYLYRWVNGRFKGDGRIEVMPLNLLEGFQVINAGDAGARSTASAQLLGTDLAAAFADGSQIILTGDAWDYKSIADQHRIMTTIFCTRRAEYAARWDEIARNVSAQTGSDTSRPGLCKDGIPEKL